MRKGEEDRGAYKSHYQILFWIFPFPKSFFFFFFPIRGTQYCCLVTKSCLALL